MNCEVHSTDRLIRMFSIADGEVDQSSQGSQSSQSSHGSQGSPSILTPGAVFRTSLGSDLRLPCNVSNISGTGIWLRWHYKI